jgi:ribosomal protein L29
MSKILKNRELIDLSLRDLKEKLIFYKKALFDLRFNFALSEKKDFSLFKKYKKSIARIETKINQTK